MVTKPGPAAVQGRLGRAGSWSVSMGRCALAAQANLSQLEGKLQPGWEFPAAQPPWMHPALPAETWLRGEGKRAEGICNNLISDNQQLNYTKKLNQRLDGKYNL